MESKYILKDYYFKDLKRCMVVPFHSTNHVEAQTRHQPIGGLEGRGRDTDKFTMLSILGSVGSEGCTTFLRDLKLD